LLSMRRILRLLVYIMAAGLAAGSFGWAQGDSEKTQPLTPESFGLVAVERQPDAKLMDPNLLQKVEAGGWVTLPTRTVDAVVFDLKGIEREPKIGAFVKATANPDESRKFSNPSIELSTNAVQGEDPQIGKIGLAFARPLRIGSASRITFRTRGNEKGAMAAYLSDLKPGTYYLEGRFENLEPCLGKIRFVWSEGPVKVYGYTEGALTDKREDRLVEMPMLVVVEQPMKEWAFDFQLDTDMGSVEFERLFIVKLR
jgi:hypothetical protein